MSSRQNSNLLPTAHQLYRKIINKISSTQDTNRSQIKKQISTKLDKHMSLLQSHRKRQLRFETNFNNIEKSYQESNKQMRLMFQEKDKKIRESRGTFLTEKKKKMENSLNQWQHIVTENKRKHLNYLQKAGDNIKQWNSKCEDSLSKKKQRLNTISSNLNERSRISSTKTIKYQAEEHQRLLQKALINPEKQQSQKSRPQSKMMFNTNTQSRISTISRTSSNFDSSKSKMVQQKRFQDYLQKLVKKQAHIKQVRSKKNELINKIKQQKQNKELLIEDLHRQNNRTLQNQREEMESRLDTKFMENRTEKKDRKEANRSLPAINTKATVNLIYGHRDKDHVYNKESKKLHKDATLQPKFQKMIMDELRNISLVSKIKQYK